MTECNKFEPINEYRKDPEDCRFCKHWICETNPLKFDHVWHCEFPEKQREIVDKIDRKIMFRRAALTDGQLRLEVQEK